MDTNDLQDKASKLMRALEDGDALKARDMLHGEDALMLALELARRIDIHEASLAASLALDELLAILAAERMARDVLKRATGEQSAVVDMAPGLSGAARLALAYELERYKYTPDPSAEPAREDALEAEIAHGIVRDAFGSGIDPQHLRDTSNTRPTATGIVRDLAALNHGRAVGDHYEDVEARR